MKLLLQIALKLRRSYWWLVRPVTRGLRAIVVNADGRVLFVRHRYGEGWTLPGGRVRENESDENALRRELKEEVGISGISEVRKLGEYLNTYEYKKDTIIVFVVRRFSIEPKRHFEIETSRFFVPSALPEDTSPGTRRRIEEWLEHKQINNQW